MTRIFKYEIQPTDVQCVQMPIGAHVLTVQVQSGTPCLWALVDDSAAKEPRMFRTLGTGHPADNVAAMPYVGTYQIHGGQLVFHVFDVTGRAA